MGVYRDGETGLLLMGARYYAPALGRFISRDPIGFAGGINVYGYCDGDPVNYLDPLGLWKTGSYWGDVGQVFKGYGQALYGFVRSPYDLAVFLGTYADNPHAGWKALKAAGGQWWDGLTGTDPEASETRSG